MPLRGFEIQDLDVLKRLIKIPMHPLLWNVIEWVEPVIHNKNGVFRVIKYYPEGDKLDFTGYLPQNVMKEVEKDGNEIWDYGEDPHNVFLFHDTGFGWHMHVQVRDQTRKREPLLGQRRKDL